MHYLNLDALALWRAGSRFTRARRLARSYRHFFVDVTAHVDISEVSGVSVQVSGFSTSFSGHPKPDT